MNTKFIMTGTSLIIGISGIILTFIPDMVLGSLNIEITQSSILLIQVIGGLYFGYGMLNWMTKESLIGGIYNRPIAVANFTHFLIAGLALIKALISNSNLPLIIWLAGILYMVLGLIFSIILFRHPVSATHGNE